MTECPGVSELLQMILLMLCGVDGGVPLLCLRYSRMQGDNDNSRRDLEAANVSADRLDGPKFKFWVTDRHKQKLDYARATALLYTLNLTFGTEGDALLRSPMVQHSI